MLLYNNSEVIGGSTLDSIASSGSLAPASSDVQTFPYIPDSQGGGKYGNSVEEPSEEYMKIANNVALSKHYAHEFMENWPLYVGGAAVAIYLLMRK